MRQPRIHRAGLWLVRRRTDPDLRDLVVGDIEQRFLQLRRTVGAGRAHRWLWKQVAFSFTPTPSHTPPPPRSPRNSPMTFGNMFGNLLRDLRFSARELLFAHPGPTAVAVLTLALGIGANTAIFSVLHSVLLQPLPFGNSGALTMIWSDTARSETTWIAAEEFLDYRDELTGVMDVATFTDQQVNLTGEGEPMRVLAAAVSGNYFDTLEIEPALGRGFTVAEEGPGTDPVAIITDGLWRRYFGADDAVIGRGIVVNGTARTVVGVLPPGVVLPLDYRAETRTELYVPFPFDRSNVPGRNSRGFHGVARLAPGVSLGSARTTLDALHQRWEDEGLFGTGGFTPPGLVDLQTFLFGDVRPMLLILAGAAGFVLAIACANVASLMLARGESRRREIGVRVALGAGRGRVARQMLTESMVLALMGGGVALLMTGAALGLVRRWGPAHVPRLAEIAVDGPLLLTALAVSLATGLLFGMLPAAHAAGAQPKDLLVDTHDSGRGRQRVRRTLLVGELALAVMLAVAAMLMVRSFAHVRSVDLGMDPTNVLTLRIDLPAADYPDSESRIGFWTEATRGIAAMPGVEAVGAARRLPLASRMGDWSITIEGREPVPGENPNGDFQVIMPGYFSAMGAELASGRLLTDADRADSLPVVVINEQMAAVYWPGDNAIGQRFRIGGDDTPWYEVVGIVRGMKHNTVLETPRTEMFHSVPQWSLAANAPRGMSVVIRTQADPLALVDPVRRHIAALDPTLPVADVRLMEDIVAAASADTRFTMGLLSTFGAVALLLAATGIYGVVSYSVRQRTREIGIRMAIGAETSRVLAEVVRESLVPMSVGIGIGVVGALLLGGSMAGLLVGVEAADPFSYVVVVVSVVVVTLLSAAIPARRAATIDPVIALRDD